MEERKRIKENKVLNYIVGNIVYIHGAFDESISENIIQNLDSLIEKEKKKKKGKIIFDIDSNGGYARYLMDLLVRVEYCKKQNIIVETRVASYAYSCGSMLACSGTKGNRYVSNFAEHLCHLGSTYVKRVKNDTELDRRVEHSKAHFEFTKNLYKKYAEIPNLEKVINDDCLFVRGQKILDWKLADKFLSDRE